MRRLFQSIGQSLVVGRWQARVGPPSVRPVPEHCHSEPFAAGRARRKPPRNLLLSESRFLAALEMTTYPEGTDHPHPNSLILLFVFSCNTANSCCCLRKSFHHIRRSFGKKSLIAQLPLPAGNSFLNLLQFFFQPLAFRGHVNLLLIDYAHIEARRAARRRLRGRGLFRLRRCSPRWPGV